VQGGSRDAESLLGDVLNVEKNLSSTWLRYTPLQKSGSLSHQFTIVILCLYI